MSKTKFALHDVTGRRHRAALQALQEATLHVASRHEVDGVIIIIECRGSKSPRVVTAGSLDGQGQAVLALAKTQLGILKHRTED